jgi:hypothetical protein
MSTIIADNGNMIQSLILQTVVMFNEIKQQHVKNNELYLLTVNADTLFRESSDPTIDANVITNDIKQNLKVELHSPKNSDMRALLILNETKCQHKISLNVNAHIGQSKAFALLQFNYANMSLENPMQLMYSANQRIDINEKVEFVMKPQDLIVVLIGTSNQMKDDEDTHVSLMFGECENDYSMGTLLLIVTIIIIFLVLIYFLLQSDEPENKLVKSDFYFF